MPPRNNDVPAELKAELSALLTFSTLPTKEEIDEAATKVAAMAVICTQNTDAPAAMPHSSWRH